MNLDAIRAALFREDYQEKTKAILTEWSNRRKTPEQLEWAANTPQALAEYLREDFGTWRTQIRRHFKFKVSEISSAGGEMTFPGGTLSYEFEADSRDRGSITRELSVGSDWFADGPRLAALLALLKFRTQGFELELNAEVDPLAKVERLEEAGWEISRESDTEVVATKGSLTMTVRPASILFSGVDIAGLLAGTTGEVGLAIDAV